MPVLRTFLVNERRFQQHPHAYLLETSEYCCPTQILAQQKVHAPMRVALSKAIPQLQASRFAVTEDYYYSVDPQSSQKCLISQALFEQRLKEHSDHIVETRRETLLEYRYTDHAKKPAKVVIVITQRNDDLRQAEIEFPDEQQARAFTTPPWLAPNSIKKQV